MKATLQQYHGRMQRVLDYIDQHLEENLELETLSGVAARSITFTGSSLQSLGFPCMATFN